MFEVQHAGRQLGYRDVGMREKYQSRPTIGAATVQCAVEAGSLFTVQNVGA